MTEIHALVGPLLMVLLGAMAVAATAAVLLDRSAEILEWLRRGLLALVVAQAAIGLALATRGSGPDEGIHWLYGVVIVLALLLPGSLRTDLPARQRTGAVAAGAFLAVLLAWRLGASG